jgi:hypothetical protein
MQTIQQHPIPITADMITLTVPRGAHPLNVALLDGAALLALLVDDALPLTEQRYRLARAGDDLGNGELVFVGNFTLLGNAQFFLFRVLG